MKTYQELKDFIEVNKQYISRTQSFLLTIDLLEKRFGNRPLQIVETGTMRGYNGNWSGGDGCSSIVWARLAKITGGRFWTVDLSQENINECKRFTADYANYISYVAQDSVEFLKNFDKPPIDLLYLDSFDTGYDEQMRQACLHQLKECQAVIDKLNDKTIILCDDAPTLDQGKVVYSVPFLIENGFKVLYNSVELGQVALSKTE